MTEKEKSLLAGCLRGEKASWDALVVQYSALVYHTIRRTLALHHVKLDDHVIEDLFQEFFLAILRDDFKKLRQFKGDRGCTLASWLRMIAARRTIDFLRKRHTAAVVVEDELAINEPDSDDFLTLEQQDRFLCEALQSVSSRERLIIELHYRKGLAPEEVASILKISVGAFFTQKSRLLDKLRETLAKIHLL